MLSGIHVGKRKRKQGGAELNRLEDNPVTLSTRENVSTGHVKQFTDDINQQAALELRSMLDSVKAKSGITTGKHYKAKEDLKMHGLPQPEYNNTKRRSTPVTHTSTSVTIQDLITEELNGSNMDDSFARNVHRLGSHYKGSDLVQNGQGRSGADEEDYYGDGGVDMKMFEKPQRQVAFSDKDESCMTKCWWWLQSSSFRKQLLISLGNHVRCISSYFFTT